MPRPAVFFDRDNTLIVNSEYLGDPNQVELLPGAADAVARARALGFATVVVSNQSGVARGMFSEDDVRAVNKRMDAMLIEANPAAIIDRHEFCPTHPDGTVSAYIGDDNRRKPKPGMILDAAREMDLDLNRSWLVGDAPRDIAAGHAAGCRTILLRETFRTASPAASATATVEPAYTASSLADAMDFIEMNLEGATLRQREAKSATQIASVFQREPLVHATSHPTDANAKPRLADKPKPAEATPRETPFRDFLGDRKVAAESAPARNANDRETALLLERVVEELRRANDPPQDFSVAKMTGALVQGFALALFFVAIVNRDQPSFTLFIGSAIFLQAFVASLFLMGR